MGSRNIFRRVFVRSAIAATATAVFAWRRRATASSGPRVTILVHEGRGPVTLRGFPLRIGRREFGTGPVTVSASGGAIVADGKKLGSSASVEPEILMGGNRYAGELVMKAEGDLIRLLETLQMEDYLPGVVMAETYASWESAAHQAQAVCARSYAMERLRRGRRTRNADYDFVAGPQDKAYGGVCDHANITRAVAETSGQWLSHDGKIAETVFHSCCGGMTESGYALWGRDTPYLRSVECEFCREAPEYLWSAKVETETVMAAAVQAGAKGSQLMAIKVGAKTSSKRAREFVLTTDAGTEKVDAPKFRSAAGATVLRSLRCRADMIGGKVDFIGSGYGHGVGLCQWGAQGMALEGRDYPAILGFYYPGVRIERD